MEQLSATMAHRTKKWFVTQNRYILVKNYKSSKTFFDIIYIYIYIFDKIKETVTYL
jgi:hypothetical protein